MCCRTGLMLWFCGAISCGAGFGQRELLAAPGDAEFLQGLEAVRQGSFEEAAQAFTKAIDEDDENGRYYLGRGVAQLLALKHDAARSSLDRALRLQAKDPDTRLWDYVWKIMFTPRNFPGPPPHKITDYADPLIMASIDFGTPKTDAMQREAEITIRRYGKIWAEREMARPELLPLVQGRMKPLFEAGKYAECSQLVTQLRAGNPGDPVLLEYSARCRCELNQFAEARREATQALMLAPTNVQLFLCRARASLRMGAVESAAEDFALAESLDSAATAPVREKLLAQLQSARAATPQQSPQEVLKVLQQAVQTQATSEQLAADAEQLVRASAALRFDRAAAFTRGVGRRQAAVDRLPADVAKLVDLGAFCLRPSEQRPVRFSPDMTTETPLQEVDLPRAEQALTKAIELQPKSVAALTQMALLRELEKKDGAMIEYVERALAAGGSNLDLARIHLAYYIALADFHWRDAQKWREPTVTFETIGGTRYRYTTPPTPAALAKAEALEAKSRQLREKAPQPLQVLRASKRGTVDGHLADFAWHSWKEDSPAAVAALEAVLKTDPWHWQAKQLLAVTLPKVGKVDRGLQLSDELANLIEPSATLSLEAVWKLSAETRFTSARKALDEAWHKDPASAAIPAYRASILLAAEKPEEARQAIQLALAIAEGEARLTGTSLAAPAKEALHASDAGLPMLVRFLSGRQWMAAGKPDAAIADFVAMQSIGLRVPASERATLAPRTVLPAGELVRQTGWSVNALLVESCYEAAGANYQLGRHAEACKQLALSYEIPTASEDSPRRNRAVMNLISQIEKSAGPNLIAQHFPPETLQQLRIHRGSSTYQDLLNKTGRFDPNADQPANPNPPPRALPKDSDDPRVQDTLLRIQSYEELNARWEKQIAGWRDDPSKASITKSLQGQMERNNQIIAELRKELARTRGK